jgi:hypothetical protein
MFINTYYKKLLVLLEVVTLCTGKFYCFIYGDYFILSLLVTHNLNDLFRVDIS